MAFGGQFQTLHDHAGRMSPPMASTASVKGPVVTGKPEAGRDPASDPDSAPQRLPGCDHLAPIVMPAMAAHVMRPLLLAAVGALGMSLVR